MEHDYRWAAGIIEGEGCLSFLKVKNRKDSYSCRITVSMTDEDVIRKLFDILKEGTVTGPYEGRAKKGPMWVWSVQNHEGCFNILLRIGPYLLSRRKEKASLMFEYLEPKIVT